VQGLNVKRGAAKLRIKCEKGVPRFFVSLLFFLHAPSSREELLLREAKIFNKFI
jgi:hypothetical protein